MFTVIAFHCQSDVSYRRVDYRRIKKLVNVVVVDNMC
jgi:hypothetical protein